MELLTPVKPSRSGEQNPKKLGSAVASIVREYFKSIIVPRLRDECRKAKVISFPAGGEIVIRNRCAISPLW
jgi:hypothetical protein